jgi:hypothetical protein
VEWGEEEGGKEGGGARLTFLGAPFSPFKVAKVGYARVHAGSAGTSSTGTRMRPCFLALSAWLPWMVWNLHHPIDRCIMGD